MKRLIVTMGAALFLIGCGQNDNADMGGPAESESASESSTTEPSGAFGGVDTGVNGTGASGNGSGGTATSEAAAEASGPTGSGESGATNEDNNSQQQTQIDGGVSQDFSRTDTNNASAAQGSENPQ